MAVVTTDKKSTKKEVRHGIPLEGEALEEYNKVWTDMEECIAYGNKHPCKLAKKRK